MARIRLIKPEFFDDPDVADLSMAARLLFIGLWTQADKEGRLVDDMRRLKARIFPFDDVDIEALAVELHGKDMIRRYSAGEKHGFMYIRNFGKHQHPHPKEAESLIPPCEPGAGKLNCEPCNLPASPSDPNSYSYSDPNSDPTSGKKKISVRTKRAPHPTNGGGDGAFSEFWSAYPKKTGKLAAQKAWDKLKPDIRAVLAALDWQIHQDAWTKESGQYIPNPATYLNQGRWHDEPHHLRRSRDAFQGLARPQRRRRL